MKHHFYEFDDPKSVLLEVKHWLKSIPEYKEKKGG